MTGPDEQPGCGTVIAAMVMGLVGAWLLAQAIVYFDLSETATSACPRSGVSHRNFDKAWWPSHMTVRVTCVSGAGGTLSGRLHELQVGAP